MIDFSNHFFATAYNLQTRLCKLNIQSVKQTEVSIFQNGISHFENFIKRTQHLNIFSVIQSEGLV